MTIFPTTSQLATMTKFKRGAALASMRSSIMRDLSVVRDNLAIGMPKTAEWCMAKVQEHIELYKMAQTFQTITPTN